MRLTDSPACLVADEHDMGMNLARLMKAAGQNMPISKPILEINPSHPVVLRLKYEDASSLTTGLRCSSTRPCWPKAARWTIRRAS
jgi:HSP90 family molecular chaperone